MSLRFKLVLIPGAVVALYVVFQLSLQRHVVFPSFRDVERRETLDDLGRVSEAIANEVAHLDTTCHDWAARDDTWDFVETANPKYVEGNLQNSSLESANVDLMYFVRLDGRVVQRVVREVSEDESPPEMEDFPEAQVPPDFELRCTSGLGSSLRGVITTRAGPMLVASRPIETSANTGPIRGFLVMGRFLDPSAVVKLQEQIRVRFRLHEFEGEDDPRGPVRRARAAILKGEEEVLVPRDDEVMLAYAAVRDIRGRPVLLIEAVVPRSILAEGHRVTDFALASTVGVGLLMLCILLLLLQNTVVTPLTELTAHAVSISRDDDLDARLNSKRTDEIGALAREFDGMVDALARSRMRLVDSAHEAGMSAVATEVLHNVGNALNSVNVSSDLASRSLRKMHLDDLDRLSRTLEDHSADLAGYLAGDERGRHVPEYLRLLVKNLAQERAVALAESITLSEGLAHIAELIKAQQSLAGRSMAAESVSSSAEFDAALRISGAAADGRIEILREYQGAPRLKAQKHKLLQILVNLLRNAREAVDAADPADPHIVLRISTSPDGGCVRFEVQDNGVGIEPGQEIAIFRSGFTTKHGGHGLGLHSSANLASELGGTLTARSEGTEEGSTFVLELPLEEQLAAA